MASHGKRRHLIRSVRRRMTKGGGAVKHAGLLLPPPELRPGGEHFQDDGAFLRSGQLEARRLQQAFRLTSDTRVLDIGCGVGRLPIGLLAEVGSMHSYVGIDVSERAVRWCRRYIERDHPGMRFLELEIHNERYRPTGRRIDAQFAFPFESGSVDVIYLYSVFSHMVGNDIERYLQEFSRILASTGRVFLTAFVEEGVARESVNPDGYRKKWDGPLHCVRYSQEYFDGVAQSANLHVTHVDRNAEADGQSGLYLARL